QFVQRLYNSVVRTRRAPLQGRGRLYTVPTVEITGVESMKMEITKFSLEFVVLVVVAGAPAGQRLLAQGAYDLPNDDGGCPANCRQIPWRAGSDQWNGGTLPAYTPVTCSGLAGNGTTNDGPAIQSCINAA